ncbi:unnamed protein product [Rotaria sordida]|uniref:Uncharacterized protein n=2 Tax=Rotaria sordida TaxID=392033 RepID=A0A814MUN5_9BILA|nr:unnamed protein product [Rotaria sordida]CAF1082776.1 unnamed protein product [Rotaria sordida]CAF1181979.1 unnamed protein product [Rotaria sordida]CAF3500232.1 unnamed protein product [Rotaria sordida]CAF3643036.1 unnamed protein product [Rotaria sordida]
MTKNRRFPFERNREKISLENFSTTEQQLYSIIRQYASICRHNNIEKSQHLQQNMISNEENHQLNQLINYLKQQRDVDIVDINNFSNLRHHNIQHWKQVKYEWQKYYREKNKEQQEIFDSVIKTYRR